MYSRFFLCCLLLFSVNAVKAEVTSFATENAVLQDTLQIQHQIYVLKRLLEREKTVNDVAQAGRDLGLKKPVLSKPDRALCEEVPANIPCAQAWPSIYPSFDVTPVKEITDAFTAPSVTTKKSNSKKIPAEAEPKPSSPKFFWLDITCFDDSCSALVTSDISDNRRYQRVRNGGIIEGAHVREISVAGITMEKNGRFFQAAPAPRR